jgi:hypothetical protein
MGLLWSLAEYFLQLVVVAAALLALAQGVTSINNTQDYITKQNYSDAYRDRYASLSSFDSGVVGKISVQEALNLAFSHAGDTAPVVVKGPDNAVHVFVSSSTPWLFTSGGKPLGAKYDVQGNLIVPTYNSNIGVVSQLTEKLPTYAVLYNYLSANQSGTVNYICNIDPDNTGELRTILLVATN